MRPTLFVLVILIAATALAQEDLINDCASDCSQMCIPGDFTPGGLQQCFRRCRAQCEQSLRTEVLRPRYYIMNVIYAPPGCSPSSRFQCPSASVSYEQRSSIGSTIAVTNSFTSGTEIIVNRTLSFAGINLLDLTSTSGFTTSTSRTFALTISKAEREKIIAEGSADGIDHGQDLFMILLNPAVVVQTLRRRSNWNMGIDGVSPIVLHVTASELKNPSTMPPNVAREFLRRGFTRDDFKTILAQDPFANGETAIDPARFKRTRWTIAYRPPSLACNGSNCRCVAFDKAITNDFLRQDTTTTTTGYTTSLQTQSSLLNLNDRDHLTFTNTTSRTSTTSSSNEAAAFISCPSPNYRGPVLLDVYWDAIYSSFMFAPNTDQIIREGVIVDAAGTPLRQEEIAVTFDGETHYTVTDDQGRYRIGISGAANEGQLVVRNTSQRVVAGAAEPTRVAVEPMR